MQNLTRRQARWSLYLSQFDFSLTHKPGSTNTQADSLSHISTHLVTDTDDNQDQIILKPDHFLSAALDATDNLDTLEDDIRNATTTNSQVALALQTLHDHTPRPLLGTLADWEQHDGLVFFKGCIYIPKLLHLRQKIIRLCHDSVSTGHPEQRGTQELVS